MVRQRIRDSKPLSHRQFRSLLRRCFRPGDAAFVLHLAECQRCRDRAAKLLAPEEATAQGDSLRSSPPPELDLLLTLVRGGYLLQLANQPAPPGDLHPAELQEFLESLSSQQAELIRHLLDCQSCQQTTAKSLAPQDRPSTRQTAEPSSLLAPVAQ